MCKCKCEGKVTSRASTTTRVLVFLSWHRSIVCCRIKRERNEMCGGVNVAFFTAVLFDLLLIWLFVVFCLFLRCVALCCVVLLPQVEEQCNLPMGELTYPEEFKGMSLSPTHSANTQSRASSARPYSRNGF